ncbi:MAG: YciI family protein [Cyclobacteriaceae bacterium]
MKNLYLLAVIVLGSIGCNKEAQTDEKETSKEAAVEESVFDEALAKKLGADDYGMKMYVMAFLKEGPNRDLDSAATADLQRQHLDNIVRMAEEGKLSLAGPFAADGNPVRGIYIFNVSSIEEARALTETDPAIQAGSLEMELRQWYGSAAVQLINENHFKVAKKNI